MNYDKIQSLFNEDLHLLSKERVSKRSHPPATARIQIDARGFLLREAARVRAACLLLQKGIKYLDA